MADKADTDLGAPLLEEHDITLNGDPINLRDLLLGGSSSATLSIPLDEEETTRTQCAPASASSGDNKSTASNGSVEESQSSPGSTTDPSSTLSLDDNRSSFTTTDQHFTQSLRTGRTLYCRAKRKLSNLVAALTTTSNENKNIGAENYSMKLISQKSSLSSSKSTLPFLKLLIPPLLIFNHFIFYQAQTKPMWNLAYSTNVTITATATTLKSKAAFDTLNLPHDYTFKHNEKQIVETFTYMDAIRKLWIGEGLGDTQTLSKVAAALLIVFSGIWPHLKLLLVHFCWFFPFSHRLLLKSNRNTDASDASNVYDDRSNKQCCKSKERNTRSNSIWCANGHVHNTHNRRSPFLRVLSTLGKWSLADVLVVCILIAVLHLDWKVNPYEIRSGVENELPTILQYVKGKYPDVNKNCEQLLGYPCEVGKALVIHYPPCIACKTLMSNAYNHPDWATSEGKDIMEGINLGGGGYAQLRVMGMIGTYFFCASVIMSIFVSLLVDVFDEKDRKRVEDALMDKKSELEFILSGEEGHDLQMSECETGPSPPSSSMHPPWNAFHQMHHSTTTSPRPAYRVSNSFHFATDSSGLRPPIPSPTTNSHLLKYVIMCLLSIISLPFVSYAVSLPTMERLVYGGGPRLLHEVVGMEWEQKYSLITLVQTTGDAGGWDTFLMLTFGMFVVVGPIIRAFCLTLHACLGIPLALLQDCIERPRHRTTVRLALYHAATKLQKVLRPTIDCLGAFCSWEVLAVALVMIQLEMPSITSTIKQDDKCREADPEHGRTCIEVQFNALDCFLVVFVSFFILVVASGIAMSLASSGDEQPLLHEDEKRYEYGQPIPQRRSGDERYLPLRQHQEEEEGGNPPANGLEQIVFV
eukprot:scaffold18376_cov160-Skeletonema_menzelii.AAC.11